MGNIEEKILQMLKDVHIKSGGHNGFPIPKLRYDLDIGFQELVKILSKLEAEDNIFYKEGQNSKLVFWKQK